MSYLIFGGRSPIALALCRQLIELGLDVHLVTRKVDPEIQTIMSDLKITKLHQCDLLDAQAAISLALKIDNSVKGLSGLVFFHRYRSSQPNPLDQYSVEVYTPFQIIDALASVPRKHELSVVLSSSPAATQVVTDQDFQYHASKAATEQLIRFASVRFAKNKLRTNGINPGSFVFKERARKFFNENPEMLKDAENSVPLGRMAVVDEIAAVAVFLLGNASSYINGEIINTDGGLSKIAAK